jgi:hypothetical protein
VPQPLSDIGFSLIIILIALWRGAWKVFTSKIMGELIYSSFLLTIACASGLWGYKQFNSPQIIKIDGGKDNRVATILFSEIDEPERRLMLKFAKLQIINQ